MKTKIIYLIISIALTSAGCSKLDLNPLDGPSSASFYANQNELELAVNDLYRLDFWSNDNDLFTDDFWHRAQLGNAVTFGTMNADDGTANTLWTNAYRAISRVNTFIANKDKALANTSATVIKTYEAEMRLIRAYQYSRLVTHFGDVPLITQPISLEEAYKVTRANKEEVLTFAFSDFDYAAANLPSTYTGTQMKRLTKGAALALKARTALYVGKWEMARDAANAVIQLGSTAYDLHPSYRDLFLKSGETSKEIIISIPRDQTQQVFSGAAYVQDFLPRNATGFGAQIPTREIFDSYECTDGKPIDESPLYDPKKPFANRDPRLTANIVEFSTQWIGYSYQPHPDTLTVYSSKTGTRVRNNDTRTNAQFASLTGFLWKKGIDQSWADRLAEDNDRIIFRLAEVLLIYAEAKIELGEVDASVLNAINRVRARGYGVAVTATSSYPAVTTFNAAELKKIVRRERRVELVLEGLRYMDLIRWRLAEKALTRPVIGLPDPAVQNRSKWPFPGVTPIDDDGIPDYTGFGKDVKVLAERNFDKERQYLWPIPNVDRLQNPGLGQNLNY
ncbi:RagB/SusD family nutrient uptake outer membrane protein [Pedobacter nyackensis]|uniref:RagB/SusD family nutrient uptake outer membrane protein n=1 Tax=Pedobacter nyackensis TaxID=475255 RepID=UPI00292F173D|nr:RagB/SusD family nutrient uptake outer membrane protein [Pedobacter nyackensis]